MRKRLELAFQIDIQHPTGHLLGSHPAGIPQHDDAHLEVRAVHHLGLEGARLPRVAHRPNAAVLANPQPRTVERLLAGRQGRLLLHPRHEVGTPHPASAEVVDPACHVVDGRERVCRAWNLEFLHHAAPESSTRILVVGARPVR